MELEDLLGIIAKDEGRERFAELVGRLHALGSDDRRTAAGSADRLAVLAELQHQLRLHLRAARHPIPTDDELEAMVARYFARRGQ
jgi:hypothetical protein